MTNSYRPNAANTIIASYAPAKAMSRLKQAQGALGDWHDCWQWLAQAEHQPDLQPCVAIWHRTMAEAEGQADRVLDKLGADCF